MAEPERAAENGPVRGSSSEVARYAVRAANRDVPWWAPGGRFGVNILGAVTVLP